MQNLSQIIFSIALSAMATAAIGQSRPIPPRSELDATMNNMVREFNSKMSGTSVDEQTKIKLMTYDAATPTLGYLYSTRHFAKTGKRTIDAEYARTLRSFHVEKTCSSNFKALMKNYGLEIVHSFADENTGKNLIEIRVKPTDCN